MTTSRITSGDESNQRNGLGALVMNSANRRGRDNGSGAGSAEYIEVVRSSLALAGKRPKVQAPPSNARRPPRPAAKRDQANLFG